MKAAAANEVKIKEFINQNGLVWNSWCNYPDSVFVDKNNNHAGIVLLENNEKVLFIGK